jgi:hypothetical protein
MAKFRFFLTTRSRRFLTYFFLRPKMPPTIPRTRFTMPPKAAAKKDKLTDAEKKKIKNENKCAPVSIARASTSIGRRSRPPNRRVLSEDFLPPGALTRSLPRSRSTHQGQGEPRQGRGEEGEERRVPREARGVRQPEDVLLSPRRPIDRYIFRGSFYSHALRTTNRTGERARNHEKLAMNYFV